MSTLSKSDVLHVAKLAKLTLSEDELEVFVKQLSSIIEYISELSQVNTDDINPTSQTTGLEDVTRIDETSTENILSQDQAVSGSDSIYNGYFKVKAILSERSDK